MIRFVHIGNQIREDDETPAAEFAFFDTILERFIALDETTVFSSADEVRTLHAREGDAWPPPDRLLQLIPPEPLAVVSTAELARLRGIEAAAREVGEASEAIMFSGCLREPYSSGEPLRARARAANIALFAALTTPTRSTPE